MEQKDKDMAKTMLPALIISDSLKTIFPMEKEPWSQKSSAFTGISKAVWLMEKEKSGKMESLLKELSKKDKEFQVCCIVMGPPIMDLLKMVYTMEKES